MTGECVDEHEENEVDDDTNGSDDGENGDEDTNVTEVRISRQRESHKEVGVVVLVTGCGVHIHPFDDESLGTTRCLPATQDTGLHTEMQHWRSDATWPLQWQFAVTDDADAPQ